MTADRGLRERVEKILHEDCCGCRGACDCLDEAVLALVREERARVLEEAAREQMEADCRVMCPGCREEGHDPETDVLYPCVPIRAAFAQGTTKQGEGE